MCIYFYIQLFGPQNCAYNVEELQGSEVIWINVRAVRKISHDWNIVLATHVSKLPLCCSFFYMD